MKTFARRNRVRRPGASSLSVATLLFVLAVVVGPLLTGAQEAGKVRWIGVLRITPDLTWMEALRGGLRDLGYVEGQQIGIIDRLAEEKSHRLPDLAAELVRLKVDVIVTAGPVSTRAAKQATSTIPIVMAADHSPVEDGFVASLGRPGGNITGLTILSPELSGKRLALLKEAVPKISRVAVLSNPGNRSQGPAMKATEPTAESLGRQLQMVAVRGPDDFEAAFSASLLLRADQIIE